MTRDGLRAARIREILFRVSVLFKGIDGVLEILGAVAAWMVSPAAVVDLVHDLTHVELSQDPHDLVANFLRHLVSRFSTSSEHFLAVYLLAHGVVKLVLVVALLRNMLWAYPAAVAVFGGFIVYQIYRYTLTGGVGLILLTIVDLIVILLIWLEYRAVKRGLVG